MNDLQKTEPWIFDPCWRCGSKDSPHYDASVIIIAECSDNSYSGTFHVPLCFACAGTLHNNLPDNYRVL